ncbi:hypothetical protein RCO27_02555 [Sphingosinicella sp. LHD-64]|uniref:hypothetical protein n=1 Tax=Sphingosinicella sp. LHD-64 TaxID=3072139 RepID=UPI0028100E22|nr:hypothetical protein [Sphingosinicella sp. LHD-64]MDQ8755100.1 hypothetical protein [Sphingosinicella sp. LHD-64]
MDDALPDDLAFDPVPSARQRRDGWTPERQRAFILALAGLGLVGAAARSVGMSRKSAYALLKRAGPESGFARAWDAAVDRGRAHALDLGIERAIHGTQIPVFHGGLQRGVRTVYDNRLLIAALRAVERADASLPSPQEDLATIQRFVAGLT